MHEYLGHRVAVGVNVLDFLRGNVFSLSQLEDVLLSVNDLQSAVLPKKKNAARRYKREPLSSSSSSAPISKSRAYWKPFANIPRVQPSVFVDGLRRFLGVAQVSQENIRSFDANLMTIQKRTANKRLPVTT